MILALCVCYSTFTHSQHAEFAADLGPAHIHCTATDLCCRMSCRQPFLDKSTDADAPAAIELAVPPTSSTADPDAAGAAADAEAAGNAAGRAQQLQQEDVSAAVQPAPRHNSSGWQPGQRAKH